MAKHYYLAKQPVNGTLISRVVRLSAGAVIEVSDEEHHALLGRLIPLHASLVYQGSSDPEVTEQAAATVASQLTTPGEGAQDPVTQEQDEAEIAALGLDPKSFPQGTKATDKIVQTALVNLKAAEAKKKAEASTSSDKKAPAPTPAVTPAKPKSSETPA
jgi:hypothetical protein